MPTCPNCKRHFRTLPDEEGDHPCPHCGWEPGNDKPADPLSQIRALADEIESWKEFGFDYVIGRLRAIADQIEEGD